MATSKVNAQIRTVVDTLSTEVGWTEDFPIQGGLHIYDGKLKYHDGGSLVELATQDSLDAVIDTPTDYDISFAASDESTALTTGNGKVTIFAPRDFTLVSLFAGVSTLGTTSGTTTIQIQKNGVDILSTALTIDQGEYTSLTAAAPAVISTTAFTKGDRISVDIDAISGGGTEKGLKITLIGTMA